MNLVSWKVLQEVKEGSYSSLYPKDMVLNDALHEAQQSKVRQQVIH